MEFNFVLSNWPKKVKLEAAIERLENQVEENLVWKLISYIFQLYESYEIKFHTKISSFTVVFLCHPLHIGGRICLLVPGDGDKHWRPGWSQSAGHHQQSSPTTCPGAGKPPAAWVAAGPVGAQPHTTWGIFARAPSDDWIEPDLAQAGRQYMSGHTSQPYVFGWSSEAIFASKFTKKTVEE